METAELVNLFAWEWRHDGKAEGKLRVHLAALRHFAQACPQLPTDTRTIEAYLTAAGEGHGHRRYKYQAVQAFYAWLKRSRGIVSPVPGRGPVGRPRKQPVTRVSPPPPPLPLPTAAPSAELRQPSPSPVTAQPPAAGPSPSPSAPLPQQGLLSPELNTDPETGIQYPAQRYPTYWLVGRFLDAKRVSVRPETVRFYKEALDKFAAGVPYLPTQPREVWEFILRQGPSNERRWDYFVAIRTMVNWFVENEDLTLLDQKTIKRFRKQLPNPLSPKNRKIPDTLTDEEWRRVYAAVQRPVEELTLDILGDTGMRLDSLVHARVEGLRGEFLMVDTKTGPQSCVVTAPTAAKIRDLGRQGYILSPDSGMTPYTKNGVYWLLRRVLERAGIRKRHMGAHLFRHSVGRRLAALGKDTRYIQQLLGHSHISTTELYTHMADADLLRRHQEIDLLGQIKSGNGKEPQEVNP